MCNVESVCVYRKIKGLFDLFCVCVCVCAWSEESEALKRRGQNGYHFIFYLLGWSKGRWGKRNNLNTLGIG